MRLEELAREALELFDGGRTGNAMRHVMNQIRHELDGAPAPEPTIEIRPAQRPRKKSKKNFHPEITSEAGA